MRISHEAIYQALFVQGRGGLRRELTACLRTGRVLRVPRARVRARQELCLSGDHDQSTPRRRIKKTHSPPDLSFSINKIPSIEVGGHVRQAADAHSRKRRRGGSILIPTDVVV